MWKHTIQDKHSWSLANPSNLPTAVAVSITLYLNRLVCQRSTVMRDLSNSVVNKENGDTVSLIKHKICFWKHEFEQPREYSFNVPEKSFV